ncbi:Vitamin B12 transporter BtuB [Novipirellula aureliae]|uniref:Vitamin B12 transporter BtuB n=1 Tax=Novipirellula aureliae TaxID=2527966 RepID=A0A5C6EA75_9BACT|nr:TonB-dependent receptor [Novipirellula aureliae]TWU44059.1 Vitamin B12 transporter BtuB [Novipirellula aureliae]
MSLRLYFRVFVFIGVLVSSLSQTDRSSQSIADEPEYYLLKKAQYYFGDGAEEIRLVQAESTPAEITQPADFGVDQSQFTGLGNTANELGGRLDLSELLEPELPSSAGTSLNSPAEVANFEELTGQVQTAAATTAPLDIVPASTFNLVTLPDVAQTLIDVATTQTVKARRRSPIGFDPRVRGYYEGQIQTTLDGGFQTPVRGDLDAALAKFDSGLIGSTEVISGPYGLRYGSGFSFINVTSLPTPRYEGGKEKHLRLGSHVRANGGQTFNTATFLGGSRRSGYYANVSYRKGSDYDAGNGLDIPSSYGALSVLSGYGFDIDDETHSETKFSFLNQGETEYAAQFFDVDDLKHYGITQNLIHRNECTGLGYRMTAWLSNTEFDGDTTMDSKRKNNFPVLQRVDDALRTASLSEDPNRAIPSSAEFLGQVDGDLTTAGIRAGVTREINEESSIGAGMDFRYVQQRIRERYDLSQFQIDDPIFGTGLPTAEVFDPGVYTELAEGLTEDWRIAMGARLAFASTQADAAELGENSNFKDVNGNVNRDLDVSDILGSFYLMNDIDLAKHWRTKFGFGYAERLPNLTDRYSDGLFLAIIQSGFSRVNGNPELSKERNWQVDARLDADYENVRGHISVFHSWILDYVTYAANPINDPLGARLLTALNTDYATMMGFEMYGEADLLEGVQTFAGLSYLEGRDQVIHQPLSGITPLEGRIGIRLSDVSGDAAWGLEWGLRMAARQDRLGTLRSVQDGLPPVTLETETPGFGVSYLRGYLRPSDRVSITGGIDNLFDKNYYEHLNLRLPADDTYGPTVVLSPGFTPYVGVEVEY